MWYIFDRCGPIHSRHQLDECRLQMKVINCCSKVNDMNRSWGKIWSSSALFHARLRAAQESTKIFQDGTESCPNFVSYSAYLLEVRLYHRISRSKYFENMIVLVTLHSAPADVLGRTAILGLPALQSTSSYPVIYSSIDEEFIPVLLHNNNSTSKRRE